MVSTPALRMYYVESREAKVQLACIVGKKVHPRAVTRHRYQRLLREAAGRFLKVNPRYDMVVVAKPEILRVKKLGELQVNLEPYFEKLKANQE